MEKTYLTGSELKAYIDELSNLISNTVPALTTLADKYNVDRDDTMQHFAEIFSTLAETSTFNNYDAQAANANAVIDKIEQEEKA